MQLGFFTAILPDLSLEEVVAFAAEQGFECLEVACWPKMKADRRYAGITHIDAAELTDAEAARIKALFAKHHLTISALGYYPNILSPDEREAAACTEHLKAVMAAANRLGLSNVNTFVGRHPGKSVEENLGLFDKVWPGLIAHAEKLNLKVGIENCPMLFTADEWPGGKNLAISPRIWREMFKRIPSPNFGLNYDPSHAVWQFMDSPRHVRDFAERIFHVHAKDVRLDRDRLSDVGILAHPNDYHRPKLPGLGDVPWPAFFAALTDVKYDGAVCIEVEDRAYEGSLEARKRALRQSQRFLLQFCGS